MPPPIRYPLPTMIALLLAGLIAWRGEVWTRSWRAEIATRVERVVHGPPVPRSTRPQVVAGPIVRRGLLLRDGVPLADRPRGATTGTIDRRMFVDIYDEWPDATKPTFFRVGNRQPLGWIAAADLLPWNTRLVVRPTSGKLTIDGAEVTTGSTACPVLNWRSDAVEVVTWATDHPWETIGRRGWVRFDSLAADPWGVWISQVELPNLLRLALDGDPDFVRLVAVLGRVTATEPLTENDVPTARSALPAFLFNPASRQPGATDRLAEANARPRTDAHWSGLSFRFLPLTDLP